MCSELPWPALARRLFPWSRTALSTLLPTSASLPPSFVAWYLIWCPSFLNCLYITYIAIFNGWWPKLINIPLLQNNSWFYDHVIAMCNPRMPKFIMILRNIKLHLHYDIVLLQIFVRYILHYTAQKLFASILRPLFIYSCDVCTLFCQYKKIVSKM